MKYFTNRRKVKKLIIKKFGTDWPDPTGIKRHVRKKLINGSFNVIPKRSLIIRVCVNISEITKSNDYYHMLLIPRNRV